MCKSSLVGESWCAFGRHKTTFGKYQNESDETNFSGTWNGFDLVQPSLASFVKDGDEPSAPLKTWNFYNSFVTINLSVLHDSGRIFAKNLIKTNNTIR